MGCDRGCSVSQKKIIEVCSDGTLFAKVRYLPCVTKQTDPPNEIDWFCAFAHLCFSLLILCGFRICGSVRGVQRDGIGTDRWYDSKEVSRKSTDLFVCCFDFARRLGWINRSERSVDDQQYLRNNS